MQGTPLGTNPEYVYKQSRIRVIAISGVRCIARGVPLAPIAVTIALTDIRVHPAPRTDTPAATDFMPDAGRIVGGVGDKAGGRAYGPEGRPACQGQDNRGGKAGAGKTTARKMTVGTAGARLLSP